MWKFSLYNDILLIGKLQMALSKVLDVHQKGELKYPTSPFRVARSDKEASWYAKVMGLVLVS